MISDFLLYCFICYVDISQLSCHLGKHDSFKILGQNNTSFPLFASSHIVATSFLQVVPFTHVIGEKWVLFQIMNWVTTKVKI